MSERKMSIARSGPGAPLEHHVARRLGPDGALLWTKVFDAPGDQNLFSAVALPDGGFAAAGFSAAKGAGAGDIWVIRLGYK